MISWPFRRRRRFVLVPIFLAPRPGVVRSTVRIVP